MKARLALFLPFAVALAACSQSEDSGPAATPPAPVETPTATVTETTSPAAAFTEEDVEEYIRLFPYQDTYNYAMRYTGGDPAKLNVWVLGEEPRLVKAGEDRVVRMNNDTFYKMAFVDLTAGPVVIAAEVSDKSRFVSFQLMDDHNTNYRNVIFPNGEYTLYMGEEPEEARGEAIHVPTPLSVVIVRVEVKNPDDAADMAEAAAIFHTITIEGPTPAAFPEVNVLSHFSEAVAKEANYRMDQVFKKTPFRLTVVGPGSIAGEHVPYLSHAAGTRGGWGGPGTEHSSYETINTGRDQQPLIGANGTYTVTTEAPPVDAFWSLTVYDTDRGGFLHPNKHDRYHINNTTAVANEGGNYTFLFKQSCGETDINCLEVPAGRFDIAARYYLPSDAIRSGEWVLPPLELMD
jgi:hypothetical protein